MEKTFNDFFEKLKKRFSKSDIAKISEDCIRYDYFTSLCSNSNIESSDIILECPYKKSKIDCFIESKSEAIEFKFFRPYGNTSIAQTRQLGNLVKDFYKLLSFQKNHKQRVEIIKIIVVANKEMTNYINKKLHMFDDYVEQIINVSENVLNQQEKTFQDNIKPYLNQELNIERIFCRKLAKDGEEYAVAIFNVLFK